MKQVFKGKYENDLVFDNSQRAFKFLESLQGKDLSITIDEWKDKRSLRSNRFYWKIIDLINKETGNDKLDIHTFFKKKFLPIERVDIETGEAYMGFKSTAKLNTKEMSEYLDNVIQFTAEFFNIVVPDISQIDY